MSTRATLETILTSAGWRKVHATGGWPEYTWAKPPVSSTGCSETSLLAAIRRQLELEDDFGTGGWRGYQ